MTLDPRWDWIEVRTVSGKCRLIRGLCNHLEVVPVESVVTGESLAHLCETCGTQLGQTWADRLPGGGYVVPECTGD